MSRGSWVNVRSESERRKDILVQLSYNEDYEMEPFERERIKALLERGETPEKTNTIPGLMKQFCVSAFSYAPLRNNYLAPLVDGLPTRQNIDRALMRAFDNEEFLDVDNWYPLSLGQLAKAIQSIHNFDLSRNQFQPRIVAVLLTGSEKFELELGEGLNAFYSRVESISDRTKRWKFVTDFSRPIRQVGPSLMCDFLEEMGFTRYVKVDHHFSKQFPQLLSGEANCRMSAKASFILYQEIAVAVGISPFHLDSILYLWGRYGSRSHSS